jgi:hypothetical protein
MTFKKGGGHVSKEELAAKKTVKKTEEVKPVTPPKTPIKAFGVERTEKGLWVLHIYDVVDGKIVGVTTSEADNKALALENFKIKFSKLYFFGR